MNDLISIDKYCQKDQFLTMLLDCLGVSALMALMMRGVDCEVPASSSLHYNFDHSYGYQDHHNPYLGYKHQHGHHYNDIGEAETISVCDVCYNLKSIKIYYVSNLKKGALTPKSFANIVRSILNLSFFKINSCLRTNLCKNRRMC